MSTTARSPIVYIVFHSLWRHVYQLAQAEMRGVQKVTGVTVKMFQVAETLPSEVITKMHGAPVPTSEVPVITADDLTKADGILFGIPTRYGRPCAQIDSFMDTTGGLWMSRALVGKMAGVFVSTSTQHGGQETTAMTFMPNLVHHGMIFVPIGYTHENLSVADEPVAGSPWGAGTTTTPAGSRQPSEKELAVAEWQGEHFAKTVARWVKGGE